MEARERNGNGYRMGMGMDGIVREEILDFIFLSIRYASI